MILLNNIFYFYYFLSKQSKGVFFLEIFFNHLVLRRYLLLSFFKTLKYFLIWHILNIFDFLSFKKFENVLFLSLCSE